MKSLSDTWVSSQVDKKCDLARFIFYHLIRPYPMAVSSYLSLLGQWWLSG